MANSLHDPRYRLLVEAVVAARKQAGLTQRDLASRLGVPPSYVGKLESLQRRIDAIELIDVLKALGVKPATFIAKVDAKISRRS